MPRRPPATPPPSHRSAPAPGSTRRTRRAPRLRWLVLALAPVMIAVAAGIWMLVPEDPAQLAARAEAAARAGDWHTALASWRAVNRSGRATAQSFLGEARACLALDLAAQADRALAESIERNPSDPTPWLLRLGLLHVEDRTLEANQLGWKAYTSVPLAARRDLLRGLTLALLTETPDDLARKQLERWIAADPADIDARVALLGRIAAQPHAGDPERTAQVASLSRLLAQHPDHLAAREALILALADVGEIDQARRLLEAWPSASRDARYYRLQGRWSLDYDHRPALAIDAFARALAELPHDWRTHYRLSRALKMLGREREAEQEAQIVSRLHEVLSAGPLGNRLASNFAHLDEPRSRLDLASLCTSVGLNRLAAAWRKEAESGAVHVNDGLLPYTPSSGLSLPDTPVRRGPPW